MSLSAALRACSTFCPAGATQWTCGNVTQEGVMSFIQPGIWMANFNQIALNAQVGDSGAPVLLGYGNGMGIISNGTPNSIYYSPLEWVTSTTGKVICTTSAC